MGGSCCHIWRRHINLDVLLVQELSKEYIERQKTVDAALVKALSPELKGYLGARFTLKAGDRPHLMKF